MKDVVECLGFLVVHCVTFVVGCLATKLGDEPQHPKHLAEFVCPFRRTKEVQRGLVKAGLKSQECGNKIVEFVVV